MKRVILFIVVVAAVGFGFEWGVYGGPGASATFANMRPVHRDLSAYHIPTIPSYQIGLSTPVMLRLWRFTIGGGDSRAWQTASGDDYTASFTHSIDVAEFGYIVDLSDHLRLRPLFGLGDYEIDLRISETGGGFGPPEGDDSETKYYRYDNFSLAAGLGISYYWKFENRVVVGFEAKARYLVPLQANVDWVPQDVFDDVVPVEGFYPHTPVIGLNFFIGYEKLEESVIEEDWEEGWEEE